MKNNDYTAIPNEIELLEFFGSEPIETSPSDGFWCYEVEKDIGRMLRISFNILDKSIQTTLFIGGIEIETVSHEGAKIISITQEKGKNVFRCECECYPIKTILKIVIEPDLHIKWESLIARG